MTTIYIAVYFLCGISMGSFLNMCIYKIPAGLSIISPVFRCHSCKQKINNYDITSLISFLYLHGKCRKCKAPIEYSYLAIELVTGLLFVLSYIHFGISIYSILVCMFFSTLVVIFVIDLKYMVIPDCLNILIILIGVINILLNPEQLTSYIIGALIISIPIGIISVLTKGFGLGDVFLFCTSGFFIGAKLIVLAAFFSIVIGGFIGSILILSGIRNAKSAIPFGPFIVIGLITAALYGVDILNWYTSLFNLV